MPSLLAVLLVGYLVAILVLSIISSRRVASEEDYVVAGRRLPLFLAWGTLLATWFGAATILGAAEAARNEGVRGTLLDPFASGLALIVAGLFFARPLWDMKLLTMGDFYARTFGPRTEVVASVALVPGYFGWIGAQFIALGELLQLSFNMPLQAGILIAAAIVLGYTLIGGMWSVTLTDTLQLVVLLFGVAAVAAAALRTLGGGSLIAGAARLAGETEPEMLTLLPEAGLAASLVWIATLGSGALGNLPGQDLMQRVFSSRDATTAARACLLAGLVYIAFGCLPVAMGLASRLLIPESDGLPILAIMAREFTGPTITSIFILSLVSIIVSTATSAVLAPATILSHNLLGRVRPFSNHGLATARLAVGAMTAGGLAMAFSGDTILELLEMSLSVTLVGLFVPLVMGIYGRPRGEGPAMASIIAGTVVWGCRELMEMALLPMPAEAGVYYANFVRTHATGTWGTLTWLFALVPSAISGTATSYAAYMLWPQGAKGQ